MKFFTAIYQHAPSGSAIPNPERGATRPYVPGGQAIDKSVAIRAFPLAGTTMSSALQLDADFSKRQRLQSRRALEGCETYE